MKPLSVLVKTGLGPPSRLAAPAEETPLDEAQVSARLLQDGIGIETAIHDPQQLEIRLSYPLLGGDDGEERRYQVDAWLFIPPNVGVHSGNYSREQFYGDLTALVRLDVHPQPLDALARADLPGSPLYDLAQLLERVRSAPRPPASRPVLVLVKLYAYLYVEGLVRECRQMRAMVERATQDSPLREQLEASLAATLGRLHQGLWAFRSMRAAYWPYEMLLHRGLADALRTADEFMSLSTEMHLAQLGLLFAETPALIDGSALGMRLSLQVAGLTGSEANYRQNYGYLSMTQASDAWNEYAAYRISSLKKAIHQALYLDMRKSRGDTFLRNATAATGAALGAIWALATQVPLTLAQLSDDLKYWFFTGAVAAYVAKDRIKVLTNEYLTRRLRQFDHDLVLTSQSLAVVGLGMLKIRLREVVFFEKSTDVSDEVRELRQSKRTVRLAEIAKEEVIHYRKQLIVARDDSGERPAEHFRLRDILRLNVRHFLVRMDDTADQVAVYDPAVGGFASRQFPKVYHINLVLRVARIEPAGQERAQLLRVRVVLNKAGIVRIDRVA